MTGFITEPQKQVPVIAEADLCVLGGSCTGVFAAVRAARLGLKVVLVEKQNILGGTAVAGLVNVWHSLHDIEGKKQVVAGLSQETIDRLKLKNAIIFRDSESSPYIFNPCELSFILDDLVRENKITVMLHTAYSAVMKNGKDIKAVFVENADGRGAIKADFFIDATGDGRVAKDLQIPSYTNSTIQPPTACFYLKGDTKGLNLGEMVREHGREFGLDDDFGWYKELADCPGITMRADNHVFNVRCDKATDLTFAEMEGRRQADAFVSMIRKYGKPDQDYSVVSLCSHIGIRETVHYKTRYQATSSDLLTGARYESPVMNGSYRIDIHHSEDSGITFRYLDGREEIILGKNRERIYGNWREKENITTPVATYYQIPFDIMVGDKYTNFIAVGRMINAQDGAYGALRVMINLNQLGEAAGVAAYACLQNNMPLYSLDGRIVTETLRRGGSAL